MIASVLLEIKAKNIDKTFDYIIPEILRDSIQVGVRVKIPFGKQILEGYVLDIKDTSDGEYELKEIIEQLDEEVILNEELRKIGAFLKEENLSSLSSNYSTMLPSALKAKKNHTVFKKYETYLKLKKTEEQALLLCTSNVQKELVSVISGAEKITKKEANDISASATKSLLKKGVLEEIQEESYRFSIGIQELEPKKNLNEEQQEAFNKIKSFFHQERTILLHGITGSGKTEIYMQLIEKVIQEKKQALVLVPEISLTPQFVGNFSRRFGENIAVLHSGLSGGEKYDEWRKIMRQEVNIVIGARSAIFAPLSNIGIIIIDECHSDSYKQENNPKYHVYHVASFRSKYHNCPVVLGSATPNLEYMARAKKNVFELVTLKNRVKNSTLPTCEIVNQQEEVRKGYSIISSKLEKKIQERLEKQEQVMILLNRRGHSTFIQCSSCGFTYKCPHCDITLTFHKTTKNLRCHYCGYTKYLDNTCPECHEDALNYYGLGTEKLESYLKEKFPLARIVRMDTDTTARKGSLEHITDGFAKNEYDILIGTQMISKGLDFPKVTLVGIVCADNSFNIPDFRSGEKSFALLCQASGRAGRSDLKGEVVIETFNPDNKILNYVKNQDYNSFYHYEMDIRKKLKYPPYYYLAQLVIKSKEYEEAREEANKIASYLKKYLDHSSIILGPTTASMFRINNIYHFEILIKYRFDDNLKRVLKELDQIFITNKKVDLDIDMNI